MVNFGIFSLSYHLLGNLNNVDLTFKRVEKNIKVPKNCVGNNLSQSLGLTLLLITTDNES